MYSSFSLSRLKGVMISNMDSFESVLLVVYGVKSFEDIAEPSFCDFTAQPDRFARVQRNGFRRCFSPQILKEEQYTGEQVQNTDY